MSYIRVLIFSFGVVLLTSLPAGNQELSTILTCASNAKASRDYAFNIKQWSGHRRHDLNPTQHFKIVRDRNEKNDLNQFILRDIRFVGLNTKNPTVVFITRFKTLKDLAEDLEATVVERTSDSVSLVWSNGFNKVWLGTIDLIHRKAIVTHIGQGATNIEGYLETFDCQ